MRNTKSAAPSKIAKTATNSLFSNILPASPCGSIFCADKAVSERRKSKKREMLAAAAKKIVASDGQLPKNGPPAVNNLFGALVTHR